MVGESLKIVVEPITSPLSPFLPSSGGLSKGPGVGRFGPRIGGGRGPPGLLSDWTAETRGAKYDS